MLRGPAAAGRTPATDPLGPCATLWFALLQSPIGMDYTASLMLEGTVQKVGPMSVSRSLMGEWLVPFKGRNDSGACDLNFLWRSGSLYVMDNHRAASWCWLQHSGPEGNANVVHIDAHYDTAGAGGRSSENQPPTASLGLREYLDA